MFIRSLYLNNFRNYKELFLELNEGVNIFYGNNAQGKTNILEAVYIASTSRSHKGSKDKDIIMHGEEESHIRLDAEDKNDHFRIDVHIKKNRAKGIAVDLVPLKRAKDLLGLVNTVMFAPEDLNIIKSGPKERRRYINTELCRINKLYYRYLSGYIRCLEQRNRLLKDMDGSAAGEDQLDIWDAQLVSYGVKVIEERRAVIKEMNGIIKKIHSGITGGKEDISLIYESSVKEKDFAGVLALDRNKDIRFGTTHTGPHRDDMGITVNGNDLRVFGSQGQIRSGALSLKLSEIEMLKEKTGSMPILLLDDVLSELDRERQNLLLKEIEGMQTLITCTGLDDFIVNKFEGNKIFHVVNGSIA